jgi:hypothetical protein
MTKNTEYKGQLHKMSVKHTPTAVEYYFSLLGSDNNETDTNASLPIMVNSHIGKRMSLDFTGTINCIACKRTIKKTYQQGYCFPCMQKLAACDMCILKPQTCHYHKETCREPEWALTHCFSPHIVYLANSSGLKVGITRETQIPTRWIDQGAIQALPILRVKSRYQAGLIEAEIAKLISDRTDWRKMLRGGNELIDLAAKRDELFWQLGTKIQEIAGKFKFGDIEMLTAEEVKEFNYPVIQYPTKVNALSFDKTAQIEGQLLGVKGQYLIFDAGVLNLRNFTGYEISVQLEA